MRRPEGLLRLVGRGRPSRSPPSCRPASATRSGPFLKPIVADLNLDRASFSAVIALSLFLYGVFMPLAGMALDRFSVRVVASAGTLLLVASLILTAMVRNVWEFTAVYGVLVPARAGRHRAGDRLRRRRPLVQPAARHRALGARQRVDDRDEPAGARGDVAGPHHRLAHDVRGHRGPDPRHLAAALHLVLRDSPESVGLTADGVPRCAGDAAPRRSSASPRARRSGRWPSGSSRAPSSPAASR